jgi:hypothetical protein
VRGERLHGKHGFPDARLFESLPEGLVPRDGEERLGELRIKRLAAAPLRDAQSGHPPTHRVEGFEH